VVSVTSSPLHIARHNITSASIQQSNGGLHCGTKTTPWLLEAPAGKRLKISLLDFSLSDTDGLTTNTRHRPQSHGSSALLIGNGGSSCANRYQYGYIIDKSIAHVGKKNVSICPAEDSQRLTSIYMSKSNTVELTLTPFGEDVANIQQVVFLVRVEG